MAAFKRAKEPGNELTFNASDGRAGAQRRLKKIEKALLDDLDLDEPTPTLKLLARRAAELTLIAEELSTQLSCGKPISVELMGRNTDRLARTMKELRDSAIRIRMQEHNARVLSQSRRREPDPPPRPPPQPRERQPRKRRDRPIRRVIIDGEHSWTS